MWQIDPGRALGQALAKEGREVVTLREPGGTSIGEAIRDVVKHPPGNKPISPDAELLLMNASRAQLVQQTIQPALASGAAIQQSPSGPFACCATSAMPIVADVVGAAVGITMMQGP